LICRTNAHEYNLRTGCNPLLAPISFIYWKLYLQNCKNYNLHTVDGYT
jgi:hypothetical protein